MPVMRRNSSFSGSRKDFDIFDLPELNFGDAATAIINGSSGKSAYAGYVGRLIQEAARILIYSTFLN